jgi:hypothetical protein
VSCNLKSQMHLGGSFFLGGGRGCCKFLEGTAGSR